MPLTTFAIDAMLDHLTSIATQVSLHSADPGTTGANETTAARQVPTFSAAAGKSVSLSAQDSFTGGAASGAVTYAGLWDASNNFLGGFQITTGDTTFNAAGAYNLTGLTITGS